MTIKLKKTLKKLIKLISGNKTQSEPNNPIYVHPDSPNYGSFWSKESISFDKVKLTHKYGPINQEIFWLI